MKRLFVTLDLESDYDGIVTDNKGFEAFGCWEAFTLLSQELGIKLTTFVTGEILDKRFPIVETLRALGSEFGAHSYSHRVSYNGDEEWEIVMGTEAFERYFGYPPVGYRAPMGVISPRGQKLLSKLNYSYDASVFPTLIPGLFNNLDKPNEPYQVADGRLLEIPFSVVPYFRIPLSISYWNFLGLRTLRFAASWLSLPDNLVVGLHMHDFVRTGAFGRLSLLKRVRHARTVYRRDPIESAKIFLNIFLSRGYRSCYVSELLKKLV